MKKNLLGIVTVLALFTPLISQAQEDVKIGKQNITVKDGRMTPEALWAMGRISSYAASPDGKKVVYQVGYYSVKHNKSHHMLYTMNADGSNKQLLTASSKNETDPAWTRDGKITFLSDGQIWMMNSDGTPASFATLASSAPKVGAICTIPVPSSVVT